MNATDKKPARRAVADWNTLGLRYLRRANGIIYFIDGSKNRPLPGAYGDAAFMGAYHRHMLGRDIAQVAKDQAAALAAAERAPLVAEIDTGKGFVTRLAEKWTQSDRFGAAAWSTIYNRKRALRAITAKWGDLTRAEAERLPYGRLEDWRDTMKRKPALGNAIISTLKTLLNWAVRRDFIAVNRAYRLEPLQMRNSGRRSAWVWEPEDEALFLRRATPHLADAFCVALWTGMRPGDLCRMQRDWIDRSRRGEVWLRFEPHKTLGQGIVVNLPLHALPPLAQLIERLDRTAAAGGTAYLLRTHTQRCWTPRNLRGVFTATRAAAGLSARGLTWYDLRGTCATRIVNAGASTEQANAVIGHAIAARGGSMRHYVQATESMALAAYRALASGEAPNVVALRG